MTGSQRFRRSRRTCLLAGLVACVSWLGLHPKEACAESFSVSLEYAAASGCPDDATFKGMIKAELGHDPFREDASEHVLVRIERRGRTVDGRIEWRDSSGKWVGDQVFRPVSRDCGRIARAAAFALALQIQLLEKRLASPTPMAATASDMGAHAAESLAPKPDGNPTATNRAPSTEEREPTPDPASSRTSPPPRDPSPSYPAALNEQTSQHTSEHLSAAAGPTSPVQGLRPVVAVGAGSAVGFGMSSSEVLLGRLFGSLDWRYLSIELAVEADLPSTTRRSDGAGFEQQRLLAGAATCVTLTRWRACVLGNLGEVRLVGQIDRPDSASVPIAEVGARIGVVQRLGERFFVEVRADGLTNLSRWTARLDQMPVWTAPRFSATLGVDVGVRFR